MRRRCLYMVLILLYIGTSYVAGASLTKAFAGGGC